MGARVRRKTVTPVGEGGGAKKKLILVRREFLYKGGTRKELSGSSLLRKKRLARPQRGDAH